MGIQLVVFKGRGIFSAKYQIVPADKAPGVCQNCRSEFFMSPRQDNFCHRQGLFCTRQRAKAGGGLSLTFHVAALRRKQANIRVNQLQISFSVSCFSGDSRMALRSKEIARSVTSTPVQNTLTVLLCQIQKRKERKSEKEEIWSKKSKGRFSQYELRLMAVFNSSMAKFKMELSNCFEFLFLFPYRNINLLVIHKAESKRNAKHFTS